MHTAITNLHALLTDLQSHDLARMSKEESDHFRINVTNRFSVATGGLQTLLLGVDLFSLSKVTVGDRALA